jgi:hypothetical protein
MSKYSPQHPVLKHLQLRSSLSVRYQVSQQRKTTGVIKGKGKIPVLFLTENHSMKAYWGVEV